jgi:putative acetyltransferase
VPAVQPPNLTILQAHTPEELDEFRSLCREYEASLPFSLCFQGFDEEMRSLPGKYAGPAGCILLARLVQPAPPSDGDTQGVGVPSPVGAVALRPIEAIDGEPRPVCEMKRLYVRPACRSMGISRALTTRLIAFAAEAGYARMKLDTSGDMIPAQRLYRSLGFVPTARYNDDPLEDTLYFALDLPTHPRTG